MGNDQWQIDENLKKKVVFKQWNLLQPFDALGLFDVVLCRNVLIYQPIDNKIQIIKKIHSVLKPYGYLFMGSAETLINLSTDYRQHTHGGAVCYQPKDKLAKKAA